MEIERDHLLRRYGWAMVAGHATAWLYFQSTGILRSLVRGVEPLCWPYFEDCWKYRLDSEAAVAALLILYGTLILATGALLADRRFTAFVVSLSATALFLASLVSLDYRLRHNGLYMLLWLNLAYIAWPSRRSSVPMLIVSFYFWAGVLKLNVEWLSGAALYNDLWLIPPDLVPLACWYVAGLELFLIWGLLSARRWVCFLTLTQLALFHLQSLTQIHWFYPLLMTTILSWFVLERTAPVWQGAPVSPLLTMRTPKAAYALLIAFGVLQLVPHAYAGDSALTGQGRVFALHMFEARYACEVSARVQRTYGETTILDLKVAEFPPRMICDPVVYFNRAQNLCRQRRALGILDLHLTMRIRRATDSSLVTVVDQPDFCEGAFSYSLFRNNAWMATSRTTSERRGAD